MTPIDRRAAGYLVTMTSTPGDDVADMDQDAGSTVRSGEGLPDLPGVSSDDVDGTGTESRQTGGDGSGGAQTGAGGTGSDGSRSGGLGDTDDVEQGAGAIEPPD